MASSVRLWIGAVQADLVRARAEHHALRCYSAEISWAINRSCMGMDGGCREHLSLSSLVVATKPGAIASMTLRMCSHC
jgi:hypothetical protein